jgi:2,4-dienoyl-CoA reductase-like NADH-dependent reductase (Old Yellow Enzyme family)
MDSLSRTDLDMISISNGIYDLNKSLIYPPKSWGHGPFLKMVIPLARRYPGILLNLAGNIWDIRKLKRNIPSNVAFSIARSLIADPKIIEKETKEDFRSIVRCSGKGDCHYYIKGESHISCPLEPSLRFESDGKYQKC